MASTFRDIIQLVVQFLQQTELFPNQWRCKCAVTITKDNKQVQEQPYKWTCGDQLLRRSRILITWKFGVFLRKFHLLMQIMIVWMNNIATHISTVLFNEYRRTFLHIYKILLYFNFLIGFYKPNVRIVMNYNSTPENLTNKADKIKPS